MVHNTVSEASPSASIEVLFSVGALTKSQTKCSDLASDADAFKESSRFCWVLSKISMQRPRTNLAAVLKKDMIYIFGGEIEKKEGHIVYDDTIETISLKTLRYPEENLNLNRRLPTNLKCKSGLHSAVDIGNDTVAIRMGLHQNSTLKCPLIEFFDMDEKKILDNSGWIDINLTGIDTQIYRNGKVSN